MHKITKIIPFGLLIEPNQPFQPISEINTAYLHELVEQEQLIVLRGFDTFSDKESFIEYSERFGEISIWPFGKVLELIEQDNPEDHIFDNSYVPLHWDGMYRPQIPALQIFHCILAPEPEQGGRTTFSNTMLTLQHTNEKTKQLWHKVTGIYQRKMEFYHSKITSPIITQHPFKKHAVIRYNEPPITTDKNFINPPILNFSGIDQDQLAFFHHSLQKALYAPSNFYAHEWKTGDIVIADNLSLLHGREQFTSKSPRHLQRIHVLSNPPLNNVALESYQ